MKEKIVRTFVREEAYQKLRDWIVEGVLEPGLQLRDKDLAEKLGVSRTPIREALLRLEDEGLVVTKPNSSTTVSPLDFQNVHHLYALVWTLEQLAMREAYASITNDHIQEMTDANERFIQKLKKRDRLAALDAGNDFHSVYVTLSKNKELERILIELKYKLKRLDLYYFEKATNAELSYEEHKQIIKALKNRDLPRALERIEKNWNDSYRRLYVSK